MQIKFEFEKILWSTQHWWRSQVQFRSIFDERHELGQEIHTNARNTAGLCGLILSCCFDLIVYITKISKHWEFAPIAWLCPWRLYIYFVWVRGVRWKWNEIEIVEAKYEGISGLLPRMYFWNVIFALIFGAGQKKW